MRPERLLSVILALAILLVGSLPERQAAQAPAFIEQALLSASPVQADIIVMAGSTEQAVASVRAVNGRVLSRLDLVQGVQALVASHRLAELASKPGVASIVRNRLIASSGGATLDEYATNKRTAKNSQTQSGTQVTSPIYLPDGGYVAVDTNGRVLIANADGSQRATLNLQGKPYITPPVVAADGTIFIAGQVLRVYAINPDGSLKWEYAITGSNKFLGGVTLGSDGTVYAADSGRFIYAFEPNTGALLWKFKTGSAGVVKANPVLSSAGSIYITTDKGYVYAVNPDGSQKWAYNTAVSLISSPVIGADGEVYVTQVGGKKFFALDGETGLPIFVKITPGTLRANPRVALDGAIYLASEPGIYALNPDGSQRFYFPALGGSFKTTPQLSSDGSTLYASVEGSNLFAIDTQSGAQRWMYTTSGKMIAAPALDPMGEVILGTDANALDIVSPLGAQVERHILTDKITQSPAVSSAGDITVRVGSAQLVTLGLPPRQWDGRPDIIPTDNKNYYHMVNPVAIDVGASQLHETQLTSSSKIRGAGVTVAVVDSGIYFDSETVNALSGRINIQYLGQADFVDPVCAQKNDSVLAGIQYSDHCFINTPNRQFSRDGYGHGTHVAGIIWNNLYDATTGLPMGIAPDANIISVRVLGNDGIGTYASVIKGLQWVVENQQLYNIRVLNLSLSAPAQTPYFADPLNRAVEQAWANGIVVLAAAGNTGPGAESITVPGNDPYVITVGALSEKRTPGYWGDDELPYFSATGPTLDGFAKPDILVPGTQIISFMYNECKASWATETCIENSQALVRDHGDYSSTASLFRMSGTSMSTAIASGVAALMIQVDPSLTPDQVKFRMKYSAQTAFSDGSGEPVYNLLQQGYGRLWAPSAVWGTFPAGAADNAGMDIYADLAHGAGWVDANQDGLVQYEELDPLELSYHYQGPIARMRSDDGSVDLYYTEFNGNATVIGAANTSDHTWLDRHQLDALAPSWNNGQLTWVDSQTWTAGNWTWGGGNWTWGGGNWTWGGGNYTWGGSAWTPDSQSSSSSTLWVDD